MLRWSWLLYGLYIYIFDLNNMKWDVEKNWQNERHFEPMSMENCCMSNNSIICASSMGHCLNHSLRGPGHALNKCTGNWGSCNFNELDLVMENFCCCLTKNAFVIKLKDILPRAAYQMRRNNNWQMTLAINYFEDIFDSQTLLIPVVSLFAHFNYACSANFVVFFRISYT